jgi:hypothetical protein
MATGFMHGEVFQITSDSVRERERLEREGEEGRSRRDIPSHPASATSGELFPRGFGLAFRVTSCLWGATSRGRAARRSGSAPRRHVRGKEEEEEEETKTAEITRDGRQYQ